MERISALIEKLREQFAAGADIEQLLLTSQLLEGELRYHLQKGTVPASPHVAVVLPVGNHRPIPRVITAEEGRPAPQEAPRPASQDVPRPAPRYEPQPEPPRAEPSFTPQPEPVRAAQPVQPQEIPKPQQPVRAEHERYMPKEEPVLPAAQAEPARPIQAEPVRPMQAEPVRPIQVEPMQPEPVRPFQAEPIRPVATEPRRAAADAGAGRYNPIREVPTLTHQIPQEARGKELNEVIAAGEPQRSLNDSWKEQQPQAKELSSKLNESPVRDLRKAVGINDRYLFISELFRGDETMYERSIKTINNFSIFQEAYYWMERELKLKLAWDQDKHSTQLFYQLVRRRFSA